MSNSIRYFLIFSISLLALLFEFLQIRIFSFQYWYHLVYFVITTALLGIAVGGTAVSLFEKLKTMAESKFYAFCFLGFAASVSLGTFAISFFLIDFFSFGQNITSILSLVAVSFLAAIPYIFFGMAMARVWFDFSGNAGKIYFFNLVGSVFGILIFLVLLQPLGAENLVRGVAGLSMLIFVALILFFHEAFALKKITKFFIFCLIPLSLIGILFLEIKPDKNKLYWTLFGPESEVIFNEWNPVARIDVLKNLTSGDLMILNDGDAQTPLPKVDLKKLNLDNFQDWFYMKHRGAVYVARGTDKPLGSVLIIGSGGGADALLAYQYGSRNIDAVEINPTTVRLVKKEFSHVVGNIFGQEGVHLFQEDGRSFIKKIDKKYDIIALVSVDTFNASNVGAYMMTENYPYTLEAFEDYWDHLNDDGFIQISRFYYPQAPRETLRVFTTFFEALSKKGIEEPEKHIVVLVDVQNVADSFGSVIVSRKPIDDSVIARLDRVLERNPIINLGFLFPKLSPNVGRFGHNVFKAFVAGWQKDKGASFYKNYYFNVRPVTDDKPFFFQNWKLANIFKPKVIPNDVVYFNNIRGRSAVFVIFSLFIQSIVLVFFLIFFPLKKLKTQLKESKNWFFPLFYFSALGAGFMFLEMALIQKTILFLGHPIYSLAVVIPALLFGVAIGSLFSSKINFKQQRLTMVALIFIILGLAFALSGDYLNFLLGWNLKTVITVIFIITGGLGFFAGSPFPSGINRLSQVRHFIPLAWAINGGFSVIGSILAVILAMLFGFNMVMILSTVFYFLAFILITVWDKRVMRNE